MKRIYANLLGTWIDITEKGTVEAHQNPITYFGEMLTYDKNPSQAEAFKGDYINVQYEEKNYRIHPSCIQIITQ